MSTRCVVTIVDRCGDKYHAYLHHDGYPEGVGTLCSAFIEWFKREHKNPYPNDIPPNTLGEAGKTMAVFLGKIWEWGYHSAYMTKGKREYHGDLEYEWEIYCDGEDSKVRGTTVGYKLEGKTVPDKSVIPAPIKDSVFETIQKYA